MRFGILVVVMTTVFIDSNVAVKAAISDQQNLPEVIQDHVAESVMKHTNNNLRGLESDTTNDEERGNNGWKILSSFTSFKKRGDTQLDLAKKLIEAGNTPEKIAKNNIPLETMFRAWGLDDLGVDGAKLTHAEFMKLGETNPAAMTRINKMLLSDSELLQRVTNMNAYRWAINGKTT
ncbi:RxLR effector protein [Phytophthora megakarya]|uniref:RxLR effector protein n=1 Tax=Phytophthora megakarya TaxID=4795 RepID=A0A225W689_9STRA|nr:RxLR effector protein [Phytophthora megakarya]